jgi:intracellular septation protein A
MNPMMLLLQMLPLLIFIIADAVFNNVKISIVLSVLFAAGQMAFFYFRTGQFDWFILLDVGLITVLGAVSIIVKNDLFFKVKPAIVEAAAIIFFLALIFSPDNFLLGYFGRMMQGQGVKFRPEMIGMMKTMLVWMSVYIGLHIVAVFYTAFFSSRKMWAFVSGPGFYLLFIPAMVVLLVRAKRKKKPATNPSPVAGDLQWNQKEKSRRK